MNYETAKANFEKVVQHMQADLKEYASKPKASPAAIAIRLQAINNLVDYYNITEGLISEEQMRGIELSIAFTRLHESSQKLVIFCRLHDVNPNLVFNYELQELKDMAAAGYRFARPIVPIKRMTLICVDGGGFELGLEQDLSALTREQQLELIKSDAVTSAHTQKYLRLVYQSEVC